MTKIRYVTCKYEVAIAKCHWFEVIFFSFVLKWPGSRLGPHLSHISINLKYDYKLVNFYVTLKRQSKYPHDLITSPKQLPRAFCKRLGQVGGQQGQSAICSTTSTYNKVTRKRILRKMLRYEKHMKERLKPQWIHTCTVNSVSREIGCKKKKVIWTNDVNSNCDKVLTDTPEMQ